MNERIAELLAEVTIKARHVALVTIDADDPLFPFFPRWRRFLARWIPIRVDPACYMRALVGGHVLGHFGP